MKSMTVAAVIASLLLLAAAPSMHALPPREVERHYYSDVHERGRLLPSGMRRCHHPRSTATSYLIQDATPCDGVGEFTCGKYICTWRFVPDAGWTEDCIVDTCQ
jgi:hypothetical protein